MTSIHELSQIILSMGTNYLCTNKDKEEHKRWSERIHESVYSHPQLNYHFHLYVI